MHSCHQLPEHELVLSSDQVAGVIRAEPRGRPGDLAARADRTCLDRMMSRRLPLEQYEAALVKQPHDVKTIVQSEA